MVRFEIKKIFSRTSNKVALLILAVILMIGLNTAFSEVIYVNEQGKEERGISVAHKLRDEKKVWEGLLTEERLAEIIELNHERVNSKLYLSEDIDEMNMAYAEGQGYSDIRELLNSSFGAFREYNYYLADWLSPEDAKDFYSNRHNRVQQWLDTEAEDAYTEEEKMFILEKTDELTTPLMYEYNDGWESLFYNITMIIMLTMLVLGFLVATIFTCEFSMKSDGIFFSTYHGRRKAVVAKIKAGLILVTIIYWGMVLLFSGIILGVLGADGAQIPIQVMSGYWKVSIP